MGVLARYKKKLGKKAKMFEKLVLVFFGYNLIIETFDFSFSLVGGYEHFPEGQKIWTCK